MAILRRLREQPGEEGNVTDLSSPLAFAALSFVQR